MELSRWVPRSFTYKEYISSKLFYVTENTTKDDEPTTYSLRQITSRKQKTTLASQAHFEDNFNYYYAVKNSSPLPKNHETLFYSKERANKREKLLGLLALDHKHKYNEELTMYFDCLFPNKNASIDWILWYDQYNRQIRDLKYTYGYKIHTAKYLKDKNYSNKKSLIQFMRKSNHELIPVQPTYVFEVFTPFTRDSSATRNYKYIQYNNIQVRNNFKPYIYHICKGDRYSYWYTVPQENPQERFSYELSIKGRNSAIFENLYYDRSHTNTEWDNYSNLTEAFTYLASDEHFEDNKSENSNFCTDGAYVHSFEQKQSGTQIYSTHKSLRENSYMDSDRQRLFGTKLNVRSTDDVHPRTSKIPWYVLVQLIFVICIFTLHSYNY